MMRAGRGAAPGRARAAADAAPGSAAPAEGGGAARSAPDQDGPPLTLALPRGRPWSALAPLLERAGLPGVRGADPERRLLLDADGVRLVFTRPADVVTYVREGIAHAGVTGADVLLEDGAGVVQLLDLAAGRWRLSLAVPEAGPPWPRLLAERGNALRVATSYPRATAAHFAARGLAPHVVRLRGAVELAAVIGLADCVVDMVDTGRTLREHGLIEAEVIAPVALRLIANQAELRWRWSRLGMLAERLEAAGRAGPD
jgi:ATP phosphoribosyltransferase